MQWGGNGELAHPTHSGPTRVLARVFALGHETRTRSSSIFLFVWRSYEFWFWKQTPGRRRPQVPYTNLFHTNSDFPLLWPAKMSSSTSTSASNVWSLKFKTLPAFRSGELWYYFGPAFVASVAYIDPGKFATNIEGGTRFGYSLLWVLLW